MKNNSEQPEKTTKSFLQKFTEVIKRLPDKCKEAMKGIPGKCKEILKKASALVQKIRQNKKLSIGIIGGASVLLAGLILILVFTNRDETYRNIKVFEAGGESFVYRKNKELTAYADMNLRSGDIIAVTEGSYLRVALDGDKYIYLSECTIVHLDAVGTEADSKTKISVEIGSVINEVERKLSDDSSYEILTPNTSMSIRGTITATSVDYDTSGKVANTDNTANVDNTAAFSQLLTYIRNASAKERKNLTPLSGHKVNINQFVKRGEVEVAVLVKKTLDDGSMIMKAVATKVNAGNGLAFDIPEEDIIASASVSSAEAPKAEVAPDSFTQTLTDVITENKPDSAWNIAQTDKDTLPPALAKAMENTITEDEPEPTNTPTPTPTYTPTPTPTNTPTPTPTNTPTPTPTLAPTATPIPTTDLKYFITSKNESGGITIDGIADSDSLPEEIVLPGEIDGLLVTEIGARAFYICGTIKKITIPDSIKSIGDSAFYRCIGLTELVLPDSIEAIGKGAFSECYGLTRITLPKSCKSIGSWAFYCCTALTEIALCENVTVLPEGVFYGCSGMTSATLNEALLQIGDSAFCGCFHLTEIKIPESVTQIGVAAFDQCLNLTITVKAGTLPEQTIKEAGYPYITY